MKKKRFKLIPVSSKPLPIRKEKQKEIKIDETEKKYLKKIGFKPLKADYIQEIYNRKKENK